MAASNARKSTKSASGRATPRAGGSRSSSSPERVVGRPRASPASRAADGDSTRVAARPTNGARAPYLSADFAADPLGGALQLLWAATNLLGLYVARSTLTLARPSEELRRDLDASLHGKLANKETLDAINAALHGAAPNGQVAGAVDALRTAHGLAFALATSAERHVALYPSDAPPDAAAVRDARRCLAKGAAVAAKYLDAQDDDRWVAEVPSWSGGRGSLKLANFVPVAGLNPPRKGRALRQQHEQFETFRTLLGLYVQMWRAKNIRISDFERVWLDDAGADVALTPERALAARVRSLWATTRARVDVAPLGAADCNRGEHLVAVRHALTSDAGLRFAKAKRRVEALGRELGDLLARDVMRAFGVEPKQIKALFAVEATRARRAS